MTKLPRDNATHIPGEAPVEAGPVEAGPRMPGAPTEAEPGPHAGKPHAINWRLEGMDCASCVGRVEGAVARLPGVRAPRLSFMRRTLEAELDPRLTHPDELARVLARLGHPVEADLGRTPDPAGGPGASLEAEHDHDHQGAHDHAHGASGMGGHGHDHGDDVAERGLPWYRRSKGRLVILTATLLVLATLITWAGAETGAERLGDWAFVLACILGLIPVARRAFEALRLGQIFTIEGLMTLAALGALVIGEAPEAALVVFLFALGELLEGFAAERARAGIRSLAALVPATALAEAEDGSLREVPAASLSIGARVMVRPGDRIPADAEVVEGISSVDESPLTGESVPVPKRPGDSVFAGAINAEGALRLRVTHPASDNAISRIIALVEEAESARAPTERFIDAFARWYMPLIVALAVLVIVIPPLFAGADWSVWIYRGLALLLIGCPCALVISVPASIASALGAGARRGLLVKGGVVIETAARLRHVAFDKTGTLTQGRPVVEEVLPAARGIDMPEVLRLAAAVEAGSSHPLARAILERAASDGLALPEAEAARVLPGEGVEARVEGALLRVTSPAHAEAAGLMDAAALAPLRALEAAGATVVVLSREGQALGAIALRDTARPDASEALAELRALGLSLRMLTGDNPRSAAAVAAPLGLEFEASLKPDEKLVRIRELARYGGGVMMVGDGINDAPALAEASLGLAMGSGTDVALETADAALLRDRLGDVAALVRLARATMANIRTNITIALGLKAVFLVTSVLGLTGLWIAILADTGATVLVTMNALRLLAFDPTRSDRGQGA